MATNPMEKAAKTIERAFATCKRQDGEAFWKDRRWWVRDHKNRVYAALDASPGCSAGVDVDFTQVNGLGRRTRKKRRK